MSNAPSPSEIFKRSGKEGERRLGQSLVELSATGFIAGFTIVFGILAMAATEAATEPVVGQASKVLGALAFATGLVLLIVQRAELFSENFFDPVATAFQKREQHIVAGIARLWGLTLLFNLIGGGLLAWIASIGGTVPAESERALARIAEALAARPAWATFISAIIGGALVALLSYSLAGADSVVSRIFMAFFVGFVLAVGPFDHVVVSVLHLFMGLRAGGSITAGGIAEVLMLATAGNVIGGVGLVTFSHAAQARSARKQGSEQGEG